MRHAAAKQHRSTAVVIPLHPTPRKRRRQQPKRLLRLIVTKGGFVRHLTTTYAHAHAVFAQAAARLARGGTGFEIYDRESGERLGWGRRSGDEFELHYTDELRHKIVDVFPLIFRPKDE